MSYGWIIDTDHSAEPQDAGVNGPRRIRPEHTEALARGEGAKFRMYDDDGELVYSGRLVPAESANSEDGFAPLDDFGMPNYGCTRIDYQNDAGEWETL